MKLQTYFFAPTSNKTLKEQQKLNIKTKSTLISTFNNNSIYSPQSARNTYSITKAQKNIKNKGSDPKAQLSSRTTYKSGTSIPSSRQILNKQYQTRQSEYTSPDISPLLLKLSKCFQSLPNNQPLILNTKKLKRINLAFKYEPCGKDENSSNKIDKINDNLSRAMKKINNFKQFKGDACPQQNLQFQKTLNNLKQHVSAQATGIVAILDNINNGQIHLNQSFQVNTSKWVQYGKQANQEQLKSQLKNPKQNELNPQNKKIMFPFSISYSDSVEGNIEVLHKALLEEIRQKKKSKTQLEQMITNQSMFIKQLVQNNPKYLLEIEGTTAFCKLEATINELISFKPFYI